MTDFRLLPVDDDEALRERARTIFVPSRPITLRESLRGRARELDRTLDGLQTPGRSVFIYQPAPGLMVAGRSRWENLWSSEDVRQAAAVAGLRLGGELVKVGHEGGVHAVGIDAHADPRWVGTGRTVVDNKGNPVKQYTNPHPG